MSRKIKFYFSFRSPFAAIAMYRLRRLEAFRDIEIQMMPLWPEVMFGGHMDNPSDNIFKLRYVFQDASRQATDAGLDTSFLQGALARLTLPEGVDYTLQKVGLPMEEKDWAPAHIGFLYAESQGKGWAYADAVCQARFGFDGLGPRDVLDEAVLQDIVKEIGLDPNELMAAHLDSELQSVHKDIIRQGESDGVFGVPFFALETPQGMQGYWGNDRLGEIYRQLNNDPLPSVFSQSDLRNIQPGKE